MAGCPICSKATNAEFKPFCSARCREVDLNKWFSGSYAVPAVELDDDDGYGNVPNSRVPDNTTTFSGFLRRFFPL